MKRPGVERKECRNPSWVKPPVDIGAALRSLTVASDFTQSTKSNKQTSREETPGADPYALIF